MDNIRLHQGTLNKNSPIIRQGQILAKVENGELTFCKVYFPYPCTGYRKEMNYPSDMYFVAGETIPEFKFVKVDVDQTPDLISFLDTEDPVSGSKYSELFGIDTSGSVESVLSQLPSDVFLEVSGVQVSEIEDPFITGVFNAMKATGSPITNKTVRANMVGLEKWTGTTFLELILALFQDRDSTLPDYYLDSFTYESSLETALRTALNKPKKQSK